MSACAVRYHLTRHQQQLPRCFLSIRSNNNIPKKYIQTECTRRTASKTDYYLTYQNRKALISLPSIGCCYATLTHRSIISSSAFFHVCVCVNTQVNNVLQLRTLGAKNQQQQPIITTISFHLCTPKSLLPFHYITLATHHSALGRIK